MNDIAKEIKMHPSKEKLHQSPNYDHIGDDCQNDYERGQLDDEACITLA
jgi:hypothetical protein